MIKGSAVNLSTTYLANRTLNPEEMAHVIEFLEDKQNEAIAILVEEGLLILEPVNIDVDFPVEDND